MKKTEIAIIGGGASGMAAGIAAAQKGRQVIVVEGLPRVGKKLLATGNGRCNLTNLGADYRGYHGEKPEFVKGAFEQCNVEDTLNFFRILGLETKVEDEGKVYPWSDQANSVIDLMRNELEALCQEVITGTMVTGLENTEKGFLLKTESGESISAEKVIIATGGKAAPHLGSLGIGYDLAKGLSHTVTDLYPGIVQIKCEHPRLKSIKGIKIQGELSLFKEQELIRKERGEILFTDYGISGPPTLQVSRGVHQRTSENLQKYIRIDSFPTLNEAKLYETVWMMVGLGGNKAMDLIVSGIMNKALGRVFLKEAGIHPEEPGRNLNEEKVQKLCNIMKRWDLKVSGTLSWKNAQVTIGGVSTSEIEAKTMESKLVKGIYFCGEILDVDGDCGGYNLQWAWSSGIVAGEKAAKECMPDK